MRTAGDDVIAIAEISKGIPDERVMQRAFSEERISITEDADFGELVYARRAKPEAVVEAVAKLGERLREGFAIVKPGRVRVSRRPRS
jgi:predicted nuclease of predicted toxin-antitoxin system